MALASFATTLPSGAHADSFAPPCPITVLSENGRYKAYLPPQGPRGVFRVSGGEETLLYQLDFHADVEITNDGQSVIRKGRWASSPSDLGLAFYRRGKLLRAYSVDQLVRDFSRVDRSVSHYEWRAHVTARSPGLSPDESTYSVATADQHYYVFDVRSGQIRAAGADPTALNQYEARRDWEAYHLQNGRRVLAATGLADKLRRSFRIASASLGEKHVWLKAELRPVAEPCSVEVLAVFEVRDGFDVEDFEPDRLRDLTRTICSLEFVRDRMTANAQSRLEIHYTDHAPNWAGGRSVVSRIREALVDVGIQTPAAERWVWSALQHAEKPGLYFHYLAGDGRSVIGHSILKDADWAPQVRAQAASAGVGSLSPQHLGYLLGPRPAQSFVPIVQPNGELELIDVGARQLSEPRCKVRRTKLATARAPAAGSVRGSLAERASNPAETLGTP